MDLLRAACLPPLSLIANVVPFCLDVIRARLGCFAALAASARVDDQLPKWTPGDTSPRQCRITVVVPAYKEAQRVLATIEHARSQLHGVALVGFIVSAVDHSTYDRVKSVSDADSSIRLVRSPPGGRGVALNSGAAAADCDILLFLHADCLLPHHWDRLVCQAIEHDHCLAGAFSFDVHQVDIEAPGGSRARSRLQPDTAGHARSQAPLPWQVRLLRQSTAFRSRILQLPYGDQALFISSARFRSMGGFPDLPLMEDFAFITNIRRVALHLWLVEGKHARVCVLPQAAQCSIRRWVQKGVLANTLSNQIIVILYAFGCINPRRLFAMYYGIQVENISSGKHEDESNE